MEHPEAPAAPRRGLFAPLGRLAGSDTFSSLGLPQFRFLLAGTALSQIAEWMNEVARGWLVFQLTHSPFQLGLLGFIQGITRILFSPVAGFLVDRIDRRVLASITQLVPAANTLGVGVLISTGAIEMWHLYILSCVGGLSGAVNMPARQVLVYDVVGGNQLTNAIALNSVIANLSRIVAPAVGGLFIGITGIASSYYAQSLFFGLATVATLLLRPATDSQVVRRPMWQGIREGIAYVRGDRTVLRLVLLNAIPSLIIYPYVGMMPVFADEVLGVGSAGLGVLLAGVGFGSIPGGLIVAGMTGAPHKGRTMAIATLVYMSMVALFALSSTFVLSFVILVGAGIGWSMMVTLNQTLLQLNVADAYRGRVLSLYSMAGGFMPFGSLTMGAAAGRFGVQTTVFVFALTGLALAAVLGLGSARVRRL